LVDYGFIIENTSQKLTASTFNIDTLSTDISGNELPLNYNVYGARLELSSAIYPGEKFLFCSSYTVPEGPAIGSVSFKIDNKVKAVDAGTQNPIKVDSVKFDPEASNDYFIGDLVGTITNQTDRIYQYPQFRGAAYDAAGKLIGCGFLPFPMPLIPANATSIPIRFPIMASGTPERVELFTTYNIDVPVGPEIFQISDVSFIQSKDSVQPIYSVTNISSNKSIDSFYADVIWYGLNDEVLAISDYTTRYIPAGMKMGPYHDEKVQLPAGTTVSRIEVQGLIWYELIDQDYKLTSESITFGAGMYSPDKGAVITSAKNNTDLDLEGGVVAACFDASGNLVGTASGSLDLPANSEITLELPGGFLDLYNDGVNCSTAQRIEFGFINLYKK